MRSEASSKVPGQGATGTGTIAGPIQGTAERDLCFEIRRIVFTSEQNIPADVERDAVDLLPDTRHLIAWDAGKAVGTLRVAFPESGKAKIGRVAVLADSRGRGIATLLMHQALREIRERDTRRVMLSAQTHVAGFYELLGFKRYGDEYIEGGVPHISMGMSLSAVEATEGLTVPASAEAGAP